MLGVVVLKEVIVDGDGEMDVIANNDSRDDLVCEDAGFNLLLLFCLCIVIICFASGALELLDHLFFVRFFLQVVQNGLLLLFMEDLFFVDHEAQLFIVLILYL